MTPSNRSAASPPEFFFDRSLGRQTADGLRVHGWVVHRIHDFYPNDAQRVEDEDWIRDGSGLGWALLSKDKRIRYRGRELAALHNGRLFCLSSGNLVVAEMVRRFTMAQQAIWRSAKSTDPGFWMVYDRGEIKRRWSGASSVE